MVTGNTLDSVITKVGSVGVSAITVLASVVVGTLTGQPTNYLKDSIPKTSHLFTKTGLQTFTYPDQIHTNRSEDFYMRAVAQITSAAPSYFPPVFGEYLDGGILQNNPAIPCVVKALEIGQKKENLFLVSLGTGLSSVNAIAQDFQTLGASMWFQTVQNDIEEEEILEEMLPRNGYHRLQHNFVGHVPSLDAHTPEDIAANALSHV